LIKSVYDAIDESELIGMISEGITGKELSEEEILEIYLDDRIEHSVMHYPILARAGWLFWGNRYRDSGQSNIAKLCKNFSDESILQSYKSLQSIEVYYTEEYIGFNSDNQKADNIYPIFVKIKDEKTLIKLGTLKTRVSRFEIMDLDE